MERDLPLRIILKAPRAGVDFGLQKGRGGGYETIQTQRSTGTDLQFDFTVRFKPGGKNGVPNFLGPLVQGPPAERFIYIDIGTYAGQTETGWSRRLKIPLRDIGQELIERVLTDERLLLEVAVPGTGRDGGPACASVKPFPGWKIGHSR